MYILYTDGGYSRKQSIGGWGVVITMDGILVDTLSGNYSPSTSARMELKAFIKALKYIKDKNIKDIVKIKVDSQYVVLGYNEWLKGWVENGWKTANKKDVKNQDLWKYVYKFASYSIEVEWVKGHNGDTFNEMADALTQLNRK